MAETIRSSAPSRVAWLSLAAAVAIGAVVYFLIGVWRVSQDVPILESSSFTACGETYDLQPGYTAFDYGSRGNAEVPDGQTIYNVRSTEPGLPPPDSAADIFQAWPSEISDLVLGDPYREWLGSVEQPLDARDGAAQRVSARLGLVEYADGCLVSLRLKGTTEVTIPRSGDWSLSLLESRPEPAGG